MTKNKKNSPENEKLSSFNRILKISSVSVYLKEIDKVPLLRREEEIELAKKAAKGDQEAKEKLIVSNLRFVVSIAKKYQGYGLPLSDLISEGNLGLITAVDKFDYKKGFHFISYAIWWIKQSIMKAISSKSRMIRIPMNRTHELSQIWKFMDDFYKKYSRRPTDDEIAHHLKIDRVEIKKMMDFSQGHSSIEEYYTDDDSSSGDQFFSQAVMENSEAQPEELAIEQTMKENVQQMLSVLPEREKRIIEYRFGLNGEEPHSLSSIGEKLNLTKERIRQIEQWALGQLKSFGESRMMGAYLH